MNRPLALAAIAALALTGCAVPVPGPTVTQTVAQTPQSCLDALDAADELAVLFGESAVISAEAVEAAFTWDTSALREATRKIEAITRQIHENPYPGLRDECKEEA